MNLDLNGSQIGQHLVGRGDRVVVSGGKKVRELRSCKRRHGKSTYLSKILERKQIIELYSR